ncbi:hypothetical protein [Amycolatopsis sp. lyj-84]|uniref:hypothetical protein n=1 Tax=Amycolatopsis sp. lyj-84 TaxID=2789284 RepID=UPI00397B6111
MANDVSNLQIDQAASFAGMAFLGCTPRMKFGSENQQDITKDGRLKWDLEILCGVRNQLQQKVENRVFKVGMSSRSNPGEGFEMFDKCELRDFTVGVSEKQRRHENGAKELTGVSVWFTASEIVRVGESVTAEAA